MNAQELIDSVLYGEDPVAEFYDHGRTDGTDETTTSGSIATIPRGVAKKTKKKRKMGVFDPRARTNEELISSVAGGTPMKFVLIERDDDFDNLIEHLEETFGSVVEGVNDPGVLKAVFMAGGPGSGKSFVAGELFDVPKNLSSLAPSGLRVVNSDTSFEVNMKKMGIDPKTFAKDDAEWAKATEGPDSPRGRAKVTTTARQDSFVHGRLGIILDSTGDDYQKIKSQADRLSGFGYDVAMIYVNTTLAKAQERNQARDRVLKVDLVTRIWTDVNKNLGKLKSLFKENFFLVDNTDLNATRVAGNPGRKLSDLNNGQRGPFNAAFLNKIKAALARFVASPVKSRIGKSWLAAQTQSDVLQRDRINVIGRARKAEIARARTNEELISSVAGGLSAHEVLLNAGL